MFPLARMVLALAAIASLAGPAVACGGDDDDEPPQPTATATTSSAPDSSDDEPDEGDDDEGGADDAEEDGPPTFEEGDWTGGAIDVRVVGAQERTLTATLLDTSGTDRNATRLIYADGLKTVNISISTVYEPFAMSISMDGFRAISAFDSPCEVTYTETEETSIAGSFRCEQAKVEMSPDGDLAPVTFEGSFTATR